MMKTTTSVLLASLLLATPALAQSQGGTGIGASLDQAQAGIADIRKAFDEQWDGEAGRWVKGGIGVAGLAAALLSASDALYSKSGKGTIQIDGSRLKLDFGAAPPDLGGGGPALTSGTTATR